MGNPRYLTKSRFKLACECPSKLYYTGKKEYANKSIDDPFLEALAEGGYQVGELAKAYFPDGHDITSLDYDEAYKQTNLLLQNNDIVIFEPAIKAGNLFIRVDVLVKNGNTLKIIEVKAKSFDPGEEDPFYTKKGTIKSQWKSYLNDIAFQDLVVKRAFPDFSVDSFLMLTDKTASCPTDGLNQKFRIVRDSKNRKGISVSSSLSELDLSTKLLIKVPVNNVIETVKNNWISPDGSGLSFEDDIDRFSKFYSEDILIETEIGSHCASCEFQTEQSERTSGVLDGFRNCWKKQLGWKDKDFDDASVLNLWNFRKKDKLIRESKVKLCDLSEEDINPKPGTSDGLSTTERQWLQVEKTKNNENQPYIDIDSLSEEFSNWNFPLHFIDFETTAVAIPFTKGRHPYEGVAFQFSHHIIDKSGNIQHKTQFLCSKPGYFPNFDFVRELKKAIGGDNGTIFRYAAHENTYLNLIYRQLNEGTNPPLDKEDLMSFIKSITKSVEKSDEKWEGHRSMVDMLDLVKKYYYNPKTGGSNSIKYVLPAILSTSSFLQDKYSKPIYGAEIKSLNFKDWTWIKREDNNVIDPYSQLPKLFLDTEDKNIKILSSDNELKNGGAALTAYGKLQFTEMSDYERKELEGALLKYCELDTFAMVLIYEYWKNEIELADSVKRTA